MLNTVTVNPLHIIPPPRSGDVFGLTTNDKTIVVGRRVGSISQYDVELFQQLEDKTIRDIPGSVIIDLVIRTAGGGVDNNLIYVAIRDYSTRTRQNCIVVFDLSTGQKTDQWPVDGSIEGASINTDNNFIITCENRILEYDVNGRLLRRLSLPPDMKRARHAIQLKTRNQFLVSHGANIQGGPLHRVCLVECSNSQTDQVVIKRSYGGTSGSAIGQLNEPRHLAVDGKTGFIFVADQWNHRIVILNENLEFSHQLFISISKTLKYPRRLHLDQSRDRLLVGEGRYRGSEGRVLMLKLSECLLNK